MGFLFKKPFHGRGGNYTPVATTFAWLVAPSSVTLDAIGATHTVTAQVLDQNGIPLVSQPAITYSSATTAKITASGNTLTAVANGTSVITATTSGFSNITGTATVAQVVDHVTISPTTASIGNPGTKQFTGTAFDRLNHTISGTTLGWDMELGDTSIGTVNSSGLFTASAPGSKRVVVNYGNLRDYADIAVTPAGFLLVPNATNLSLIPHETGNLTYTYNGVDVTNDPGLVLSSSNPSALAIDPPVFTSITENTVRRNDSAVSHAIVGDNLRSGQTLEGWPSGVTSAPIVATSSTTATVAITVNNTAIFADVDIYINDNTHGISDTLPITIAPQAGSLPAGNVGKWESDHGTDGLTDGAAVGAWTDQISGLILGQSTSGKKPVLKTNILNSLPVIRFDGTKWLRLTTNPTLFGTDAMTIVAVVKAIGGGGSVFSNSNETTTGIYTIVSSSWGVVMLPQGAYVRNAGTGPVVTNQWEYLSVRTGANSFDFQVSGTVIGEAGTIATTANGTPLTLGASAITDDANGWDGDIAAIYLFDHKLSDIDLASVFDYITTKYAL